MQKRQERWGEKEKIKVPPFIKKLELPPSAKNVLTFLYLFARADAPYFGSEEYMAKRLALSTRSIRRAKALLISKGLVEKIKYNDRGAFRCNMSALEALSGESGGEEPIKASEKPETETGRIEAKVQADTMKAELPKPSEVMKKYLEYTSPEGYEAVRYAYMINRGAPPEHKYVKVGSRGYVFMTEAQLLELSRLVACDRLEYYILLLERIIDDAHNNLSSAPKNHYRIIRKWITDDTAV